MLAVGDAALGVETNCPAPARLRATVRVDSKGIFLHQVLELEQPVPSDLRLTNAPAPGKALDLSRAQIIEAAQRLAPELSLTNLAGAERIKVSRRLRTLEEIELKELLAGTLQREKVGDRGELELRLAQPWGPVEIPDEPFQIKLLQMPTAGLTPNFILRFELLNESESLGVWQVPLQAKLWHDVWVAHSAQPRGRLLREADLVTERRDVLTLRDALTTIEFQDPSLELTQNLEPGAPLVAFSVHPRPVIRRGKLVNAVVQEGSLLVTVKAEALEDGLPGQTIRLLNANSKREFRGKVQNEQTVLVPL
jgi:flagella basal body P-ring formation protein FlgA